MHAHRDAGFTLAEMAIVLLILAVLLGGLVQPLSAQLGLRQERETRQAMADIREALLGFAMANGRLPCPAAPTIADGSAGAGEEDCSREHGVLPAATLGVQAQDAWGRRYTYRVSMAFACRTPPVHCDAIPSDKAMADLTGRGDITITDGHQNIATSTPAVFVSHGRNGAGAYLPDGRQLPMGSGDEAENADADTRFVSHGTVSDDAPAPFDDLLAWIPLNLLQAKWVSVGRLP
ncbi:MAG: prepilin-type N-terminal cleavage/methylation domain-containing protein [Zoogloea sp.]|nr:prepilin-type N-terminal cleavage/methylation domain-containing protein [Zoogloea sp.]